MGSHFITYFYIPLKVIYDSYSLCGFICVKILGYTHGGEISIQKKQTFPKIPMNFRMNYTWSDQLCVYLWVPTNCLWEPVPFWVEFGP